MAIQYFCRLTPLGEYFLGGERTFQFGNRKGSSNNYFIHSEEEISQATALGMLRFILLKKYQLMDEGGHDKDEEKKKKQEALIGTRGFMLDSDVTKENDYGMIDRISPILIYDGEEVLVHMPLNHKKNQKEYTPLSMKKYGLSDVGNETFLPEDFDAKVGLSDAFFKPDQKEIVAKNNIFTQQTRTRVSKVSEEDGFFKKTYLFLKKGYSFGFYVTMKESWEEEPMSDEIVYLGQEKSAFVLSFEKKDEKEIQIGGFEKKNLEYQIFYALSDTYFQDFSKVKDTLLYSIIEKKAYRFLTKREGTNYVSSKEMSNRFQFVKAGSVFYVRKEKVDDFMNEVMLAQLRQIGFNHVIKL